jgi:hypothetical protein
MIKFNYIKGIERAIRMSREVWARIEGADNAFVSNLGNIKRNGVILIPKIDSEGYLRVSVGGTVKRDRVHRFVAKYFVPNPQNKKYVNHKDGDNQNNKKSNLEWCTARENTMHAYIHGQLPHEIAKKTGVIATCILTSETKEFESQGDTARALGISDSEVNKVLRGKRKTSHGYKFRYAE